MRAWLFIRTSPPATMRTSRVSKETSRHFKREADTTVTPRRSTRSSLARFAFNNNPNTVKEEVKPEIREEDDDSSELSELEFGSDIEDAVKKSSPSPPYLPDGETATATRKRKRATKTTTTPRGRVKIEKNESSESEVDFTSVPQSQSSSSSRRVRKPVRTVTSPSGAVKVEPPSDWEEMYALVKEMRISGPAKNAAVDTMGCERLADDDATPRDRRFHTLVALMLSSQTKDTVNAEAMRRLKKEMPACAPGRPKGLNLENMLAVEPGVLNEMIGKVGFHNNKTKYLKQTAVILRDKFNSDIPPTIAGLTSLPGVGPKMAHLCMSAEAGWNRVEGIGVDVHVHRITNLWGWQSPPSKTPEETRMALQSWLPKDRWKEINWLLVGFGQSVCLPIGRKCGDCELGLRGLCKSAERKKVTEGRRRREVMKIEKVEEDEDGEETVVKMEVEREVDQVVVKEEVVNEEVPDGAIADEQVEVEGVKKEEAPEPPPPPMKVEDVGNGEVLMSIETDDVKEEIEREPSLVKEEKVEGSDVEEVPVNQVPVKQEAIKQEVPEQDRRARRVPSRVVKTETKEEDAEMADADAAPIKQEVAQRDPVKQEAGIQDPMYQARRSRRRVVKTEVEREDEEMVDIEPIKKEEPVVDVQYWQQGEVAQPIKKEEPVY